MENKFSEFREIWEITDTWIGINLKILPATVSSWQCSSMLVSYIQIAGSNILLFAKYSTNFREKTSLHVWTGIYFSLESRIYFCTKNFNPILQNSIKKSSNGVDIRRSWNRTVNFIKNYSAFQTKNKFQSNHDVRFFRECFKRYEQSFSYF